MRRVVVAGAGTGGIMAANRLAKAMADDIRSGQLEVVVLSDTDTHLYQPGLLNVALGQSLPDNYQRSQKRVIVPGVKLVHQKAIRIDRQRQIVELENGQMEAYDYLVIATGSHPNLDAIPGFREGGHSFYTLPEAMRLRKALQKFDCGKLLLVVGVPHKCPVAPLEFIFMFDDWLRKADKRDKVELTYTYPIGRLHALEAVAAFAEKAFEARNIYSETFFNVETVDPINKTVSTLEGEEVSYDLLVGIPPHTGAKLIQDSGLGDAGGWVPTDRKTLKMKDEDYIYVVGDATNLPISKAGSTAHYQSEVVVQNLVHELHGERPLAAYDGKVFCFVEASMEEATHITFDYENPPSPNDPSKTVHWFKQMFNEMYWMSLRGII